MLTVPMAWGTFEPAVRYVYSMDPPLPGFVFSVGYYSVAAVTLLLLSSFVSSSSVTPPPQDNNNNNSKSRPPTTVWTELTKRRKEEEDDDSVLPVRGGFELGTYLFVGNACQVIGLKTVASDRAAFLLQLTTVSESVCVSCVQDDDDDDKGLQHTRGVFLSRACFVYRYLFPWYRACSTRT